MNKAFASVEQLDINPSTIFIPDNEIGKRVVKDLKNWNPRIMKTIEEVTDRLFNEKWENFLPDIPSNFVDIVITSPVYNVSLGNNKFRDKNKGYDSCDDNMPYEDYLEWMDKLFSECYRVLKPGGRIAINIGDGSNGSIITHVDFSVMMRDKHKFIPITTIVWNKKQIGGSTSWGSYQSPSNPSFPTPFEFIIVMAKETRQHVGDVSKISVSGKDFQRNSRALWEFPPETRMMELYGHPAAFPEELPRRLIDQLTYEGDVVLDPFSGIGTTCSVAKQMKRHYIGIEISEKYHNTALQRIGKIPTITEKIINGKKVDIPDWLT